MDRTSSIAPSVCGSLSPHVFSVSFCSASCADKRETCTKSIPSNIPRVCGTGNEDNEFFLLHCPLFDLMRTDLFSQPADVPALDITSRDSKDLCELLLNGTSDLNEVENGMIQEILLATLFE